MTIITKVSFRLTRELLACQTKFYSCYYWHFWTLRCIFEVKMIKKICLGVFRFEIGALRKKLDTLGYIGEFRDPNKCKCSTSIFSIAGLGFLDWGLPRFQFLRRWSSSSNLELRLGLQRSLQLAYCMGEARKELARSLLYSGKAHCTKVCSFLFSNVCRLEEASSKLGYLSKIGDPPNCRNCQFCPKALK